MNTSKNLDSREISDTLLQDLIENDKLGLDDVKEFIMNAENFKRLKTAVAEVHPYSIWKATDGRWKTHIDSNTKNTKTKRKLLVRPTERQLYEALEEHYDLLDQKKKLAAMTLCKLYPMWLDYKRIHTRAESYILRINTDWKSYYLGTDIIDIPIKKLNKLTLDNWAHSLIKDYDMTKNQYYNVTTIMRQALSYAVDLEIIEENPFLSVKIDGKRLFRKVKKKPDYTQVFTKEELSEITVMAWEDFQNHTKVYELAPLALLFQFQTGVRLGELCVLRYEDIESPDYIHIQRMLERDTNKVVLHTKSECGDRYVLLTDKAKKLIAAAKERQEELGVDYEGYIFSINGKPLTERSVADSYEKYCRKAGIIQKSSHKARKTYISSLFEGNVAINRIRELVGHSDERTTLRNYCFDRRTESENKALIEKALS